MESSRHTQLFKFLLLVVIFSSSSHYTVATTKHCRCLPHNQKCWPSPPKWQAFNNTIGGRLIKVSPPAVPCYPGESYNPHLCLSAQRNWGNLFWRTSQPGAYQDNTWQAAGNQLCRIDHSLNSTCVQGLVPVLAVDASQPSHVQSAVRFASAHNLRLAIKNTGHDFQGRSRAAGSFGIWVHNLNSIKFHSNFTPSKCPGVRPSSAVKVGAGVQWEELYKATFDRELVIVGGGCSSVGAAGGHPQGGGHSPLSPAFGLAADNVLQLEVVVSTGELLVANPCQNPDLFWALRGGGGGTFGVVVSATHKTHPAFRSFISPEFSFTPNSRIQLHKLLRYFIRMTPMLSDAGWSGHSSLSRDTLTVKYLLPNQNTSIAEESIAPLLRYARELRADVNGGMKSYSSFYHWHLATQCDGMIDCYNIKGTYNCDVPVSMASRLIPRKTFEGPASAELLTDALLSIVEDFQFGWVVISFVGGGQVAVDHNNAVNPAWRKALWHVLMLTGLRENATKLEMETAAMEATRANGLLRDVTPGSGSYANEGDYNEPDWQRSFFGDKYSRLLEIKRRYDPLGLFVCHHCVGSEEWSSDTGLNCRVEQNLNEWKDA